MSGEPEFAVAPDRPVLAAVEAVKRTELRREGRREIPAGPKGRRTRSSLLRAAEELFVDRGYLDTTVSQIAERAGVSLGTFYIYFHDRTDVVRAILLEHLEVMVERSEGGWRINDGVGSLYRLVEAFVSAYSGQAALLRVWEETCHVDPELAEIRRDLGRVFTEGVERELVRGGRAGLSRRFTPREASLAARALAAMVDRFCYVAYVFDPPPEGSPTAEESARLLTELWAAAIELRDE